MTDQDQSGPWNDYAAPTALPPSVSVSTDTKPWEDYGGTNTNDSTHQMQEQPDWISKFYHPAIVGSAMSLAGTAGAIAGLPGGPIGSGLAGAATATAMYPIANQAANAIDQMRGMQQGSPSQGVMSDLGTGAEVEAGGRVLGAAIGAAAPAVKSAIIKSISTVFGPSTDAIEAWLQNPSLPNSPNFVTLARKFPETLNNLKGLISQASDQAGNLLSNSADPEQGAIAKSDILNIINKQADSLKTNGVLIGQANQAAADHLQALSGSVNQLPGDYIPQTSVKSLIGALDNNINFADKGASATNTVLANIRSDANQLLKTENTAYSGAMKEISGMMGTLEDAQNQFGITNQIGQGLQPTDTTISKLQSVIKDSKSISQDTLSDLKKLTGDDYLNDAKNAKYAEEFQKGSAQGSRRVLLGSEIGGTLGAAAGGMIGHPTVGAAIGGPIGGMTGAIADKFGGPMAGVASRLFQTLSQHLPVATVSRIISDAFAGGQTGQTQSQGQ